MYDSGRRLNAYPDDGAGGDWRICMGMGASGPRIRLLSLPLLSPARAEGLVAEEATRALANVAQEFANAEQQLRTLLPLLHHPDSLAALPPLDRAATFLSLSKALNAIFSLHLRCKGLAPDDHLASSEVERVSLYDSKVGHFIDSIKAPKHRTTVLDVQAVNRFIEHAIPDLTEEQRKDIQDINRQNCELKHGFRKSRNLLSMPVRSARTQSITEAAAAFLEEAKKELLEGQKREGEVE